MSAVNGAAPAPCIDAGGYPWPYGACLNADDINQAFQGNPGLSPPTRIAAFKRWIDLNQTGYALERYSDGVNTILTGAFDTANHLWLPLLGGGVAEVSGSGVIDLGLVNENLIRLTANQVTGFGASLQAGCAKIIVFTGASELVQAAGALLLVGTGGQSVTTAAGDMAIAVALGGGVFAAVYLPLTPAAPSLAPPPVLGVSLPGTQTVPPGTARVYVAAGGPVTLELPANDVLVMDRGPQAGTYPITCQPPTGTINGLPYYTLVGDWASAQFIWDGSALGLAG